MGNSLVLLKSNCWAESFVVIGFRWKDMLCLYVGFAFLYVLSRCSVISRSLFLLLFLASEWLPWSDIRTDPSRCLTIDETGGISDTLMHVFIQPRPLKEMWAWLSDFSPWPRHFLNIRCAYTMSRVPILARYEGENVGEADAEKSRRTDQNPGGLPFLFLEILVLHCFTGYGRFRRDLLGKVLCHYSSQPFNHNVDQVWRDAWNSRFKLNIMATKIKSPEPTW